MYHISNDKRSKESSAAIYEALETLMREKSYEDVKITDICEVANVGRVTFYRHYDTIDDVLHKKCDEKFDGMVTYFKEFYAHNSGNEPFLKPTLRYWYINSGILELVIKANKAYLIHASFGRVITKLEQLFRRNGVGNEGKTNYFPAIRNAVTVSILAQWISNGKDTAPDELTTLIIEQIKNGGNLQSLFY